MKPFLRILCALLCFVGVVRAQTWSTFELRGQASFAGRSVSMDDGSGSQNVGTFSLVIDSNATPPQGYASLSSVSIDTSASAQSWVFTSYNWTAVVDASTLQAASNSGQVLWLNFQPPSPATLELLIPGDRNGHAFALVQNGSNSVSLGDWFENVWIRGSASFDPSLPFYVEDLTTNERSSGSTLLLNWTAPPEEPPPPTLESVSFVLDEGETGGRFTLHYQIPGQSEMVQSIVAGSNSASGVAQMGDGSWVDVTNSAIVTGSVAVGSDYWLTRDVDGWNTQSQSTYHLSPNTSYPQPLQWSLRGVLPPPPSPWQAVSFYIASGFGSGASVHQPGGTRSLTYVGDGVVQDLDDNGNPHDFYYEEWTTEIDSREPFWLHVNATELSQGDTWYYNGWQAIGGPHSPPPPEENWQTIFFQIAQGYGSSASLTQQGSAVSLSFTGEYGSVTDYDSNGMDHSFSYERWSAWLDANQPFILTAGGSELPPGETWFYNGWTPINGTPQNWHQVNFQIALGFGSAASLSQNGNGMTLENANQTDVIPDLDGNGQDHSFQYERWTAWLLADQPFTLAINGTPLPENETWFYNGWAPIGGPAHLSVSITLHESRAGNTFTLTSPGGGSWEWTPGDWSGTQTVELTDGWHGGQWQFSVATFGATRTFDHNRTPGTWWLTDTAANESWSFDPNGASEIAVPLGDSFAPATGVALNISLSRWGHDLRIRQRNGEEYSITPYASQGTAAPQGAVVWYANEHQFTGSGFRRPVAGLDWWVYDADTEEEAPWNEGNLSGWFSMMPPDDVNATRVAMSTAHVTWSVLEFSSINWLPQGGFYIERQANGGEWTRIADLPAQTCGVPEALGSFQYTDAGAVLGAVYRYRIAYYYGEPNVRQRSTWCASDGLTMPADSDNDGMNDAWEVAHGLVVGVDDSADDEDEDGWSNLDEFLAGMNPNEAPQDDPDGTHVRLVVFTRLE